MKSNFFFLENQQFKIRSIDKTTKILFFIKMRVRIVNGYFASDEVYKISKENGHTAYMAEGYIAHLPSQEDPFYHVLLDIHPLFPHRRTLLVTYLNRDDFMSLQNITKLPLFLYDLETIAWRQHYVILFFKTKPNIPIVKKRRIGYWQPPVRRTILA